MVVQHEDECGDGVGEVKLHYGILLAVDCNMVCGGPGREFVKGVLKGRNGQGRNYHWQW